MDCRLQLSTTVRGFIQNLESLCLFTKPPPPPAFKQLSFHNKNSYYLQIHESWILLMESVFFILDIPRFSALSRTPVQCASSLRDLGIVAAAASALLRHYLIKA